LYIFIYVVEGFACVTIRKDWKGSVQLLLILVSFLCK